MRKINRIHVDRSWLDRFTALKSGTVVMWSVAVVALWGGVAHFVG